MQERFCAGLALTAAYWAEPTTPDADAQQDLDAAAAAARNVRCTHPVYRTRPRRTASRGRA
jgi:hypothetical protein